jgi:hypothetical protein
MVYCFCCAEHGDVLREIGVFVAMELCSLWNKVQRLQQEQQLLLREMNGYLSYFKQQLDSLRSQTAATHTVVIQSASLPLPCAAPVLQVGVWPFSNMHVN